MDGPTFVPVAFIGQQHEEQPKTPMVHLDFVCINDDMKTQAKSNQLGSNKQQECGTVVRI